MMDTDTLDYLRSRFDYQSWPGQAPTQENLYVWQLKLAGNELPGWQVYRIQGVDTPNWPPSIQSIWLPQSGDTETLLSVDLFECASQATAGEVLLRVLGEFQSPEIVRRPESEVGEVAFSGPDDTHLAFARANLVLIICNAGSRIIPVISVARQLDTHISRRESSEQTVIPTITRLEIVPATGEDVARLEIEASDPLDRSLWYKFFASGGEIHAQRGELRYRPVADSQSITALAVNPNSGIGRRELDLGSLESRST